MRSYKQDARVADRSYLGAIGVKKVHTVCLCWDIYIYISIIMLKKQ